MCINNNSTMFNHDMDIINMLNKDTVYLHSKDLGYYIFWYQSRDMFHREHVK